MNEEQYRSLCDACDKALLKGGGTTERVAIPFLHVIREHPMLLAAYTELFDSPTPLARLRRRMTRAARNQASWLKQILRAVRGNGSAYFSAAELPKRTDVLFVSHLLNDSFAGNNSDFYYGDLPHELASEGWSVVIALINYTGVSGRTLIEKWGQSSVSRTIFSDSLDLGAEISNRRLMRAEALHLRQLARNTSPGLFRNVLVRASQEALGGGALSALRYGAQIHRLVQELRPAAIVVTHEGHAWERVAFASARQASPGIQCIGYQHAALFRLQHAIQRSLEPSFNPDAIVTAGEVSKEKLQHLPGLKGIPISVLGSVRTFKGRLGKKECIGTADPGKNSAGDACLVLPEGFVGECHLLFQFSLACAKLLPDVHFIWRLHPSITFAELREQSTQLGNLPPNIELSKDSLEEDTSRSRWVLYRGTTAVVQAAAAGVRPIYLLIPDEMTIDPLYEINEWRVIVSTVEEFRDVIYSYHPHDSGSPRAEEARKYCESFFTPLNVEAISRLLPNAGQKATGMD